MMPDLTKYDPKAVFATAYVGKRRGHYVIFRVRQPRVLERIENGKATNLKYALSLATGLTGEALSEYLLRSNINVVHSLFEYAILDPAKIEIVETSEDII